MTFINTHRDMFDPVTPQQRMQAQVARIDEVLDRGAPLRTANDPAPKKDATK